MGTKDFSRRDFIKQAGMAFSAASAATMLSPTSVLAGDAGLAKGKIKFSMYIYTLMNAPSPLKELDIVDVCRRTRELGIDGLDFIGAGYNKPWKEIRKITDDHGLKTICYTRGVSEMVSPNKSDREKGIEEFKKRLETAHILGTNRIMMNQSGRRSGNESATNRKWMIESLKNALPLAKAAGIEVTIETHDNPKAPFKKSADFSEAIAVCPDLRVCFDTGNDFFNGEDPVQGFLNNKDHITHMHFKDFKYGTIGKARKMCVPGEGVLDFPSIIKVMKEHGYTGYVNLERGAPDGFDVYKRGMKHLGPLIS